MSPEKLLPASILLIVTGFVAYIYVARLSGGFEQWVSVGRGGTDLDQVRGYWPELTQATQAGVLLLLFRANLFRISLVGEVLAWGVSALMWFWYLYFGSRSRVISFTVAVMAAYYLPRRRNPNPWLAAIVIAMLYTIVIFQQEHRDKFTNLSLNLEEVDKQTILDRVLPAFLGGSAEAKKASSSQGTEFNCAMSVVELVPERVPYNYGYGFLEILTRPIPRALWPGKVYPHMESVQGVLYEAELSHATVSTGNRGDLLMGPAFCFVGHWYYVGGFVALLIGGVFTGILIRTIRGLYDQRVRNHSVMIIYPLLLMIGFAEAASTPLYWIFSTPFTLAPALVVIFLCRDRQQVTEKSEEQPSEEVETPQANHMPEEKPLAGRRRRLRNV